MLDFIYSLLIGVFAWVFTNLLIEDGEILGFYGNRINRIESEPLHKMLGGCTQCFSGQLSLWIGVFYLGLNLLDLALFITLTIFTTIIIDKWK